jgi:hypothetical protein
MIYSWYRLWSVLLSIKCVWSLTQSEYGLYWGTLDDPYGRIVSQTTATIPTSDLPIHKTLFSKQMTQTQRFGLPKCIPQQNECKKIGIVGAGEFSSEFQ